MSTCGGTESYMPTKLVRTFHDLPRFNRHLKSVPATFDLSWDYAEGAVSLPAVLIAFGVLLLLIAVVYLCCCACKSGPTLQERYTTGKSPGCGCFPLFFFALLCCGTAALAFFGNQYMRSGVTGVSGTIQLVNTTVVAAKSNIDGITENLKNVTIELTQLEAVWRTADLPSESTRTYLLQTTEQTRQETQNAEEQSEQISDKIKKFYNVMPIKQDLDKYDKYRWEGTIGMMCLISLVTVIAWSGICCKSPCMLRMMVLLALVALLIGWIVSAVFMIFTVVGSDLCFAPNKFISSHLNSTDYFETTEYVIYCGDCPNPFQATYDQANNYLYNASVRVVELHFAAKNFSVPQAEVIAERMDVSLKKTGTDLHSLGSQQINCTVLNGIYMDFLSSTCGKVMDGSAFTFAGGSACGLLMFFVILASQRHWTRLLYSDELEEDTETSQLLPPRQRRSNNNSRVFSEPAMPMPQRNASMAGNPDEAGSTETLGADSHVQSEKGEKRGQAKAKVAWA